MSHFSPARRGPKRETQFKMLMTADERAALDKAASEFGMTASDLIREALNEYIERRKKSRKSRRTPRQREPITCTLIRFRRHRGV